MRRIAVLLTLENITFMLFLFGLITGLCITFFTRHNKNRSVGIGIIILTVIVPLILMLGEWFWNTTGWWGIGILSGIVLLIIFRKTILGISMPKVKMKLLWWIVALVILSNLVYFLYPVLQEYRFGDRSKQYETIKEDEWFKAKKGAPFKKEVANFEGDRWPIIKGRDTVTLIIEPPRGPKWVYQLWNKPDSSVGYKEIKKIPDIIPAGTYLYTTDKDCEIMFSTKKPKL